MSALPTITSVQYSPGSLLLYWNSDGGSAFSIQVSDTTAGTSAVYPATGFSATLKLTLTPPDDAWTVAIACTDGGTTGPYSAAIPILTAAPAVTSVLNLTSAISASWSAQPAFTGSYAVTLQVQGQSSTSKTTTDLAVSFDVGTAPSGTATSLSVQLKVMTGTAQSLGPSTVYAVITAVPAMLSVDYSNGSSLELAWTPPPGYNSFRAFLQSSAGGTAPTPATGSGCTIPGPLTGATYTASVAATSADGVSVGPPTLGYVVITAIPVMSSVINTGAGIALAWQATPDSTAYKAVLQVPGSPQVVRLPTAAAYTFPGPLSATGSTCWVSGTSNDGIVLGPPSAVYTLLVDSPVWNLAAYDAGQLGLSWTAPGDALADGLTGYLITISGLTPPTYAVNQDTSHNLSVALVPFTSYPTMVAGTNGIVQGPPGPALVPLTAPPLSPSLGYTGTALSLAWRPSGEANVTGYSVELLSNGGPTEAISSAASPQAFTTAFTAGAAFTAKSRSSGPGTLGPWSATATGPYKADISYVYDSLGRMQTVAWSAGFTESYTFDSAGNLLTAAYTATPSED